MTNRFLLASFALFAGSSATIGTAIGCSSSPEGPQQQQGAHDSGSSSDTGAAADTGSTSDSGGTPDAGGGGGDAAHDAPHDAPPPDALYGCATMGGFGWTCTATTTGPDPTECTDPAYPDCFVGGQGAWCTKMCGGNSDCTTGLEDAGCAPTSCNTKGYCK